LGVAGAALATTMSLLTGTFIGLMLLSRIVGTRIDRKWYFQVMGLSCIAIACFLLGRNFVGSIVAGCVVLVGYIIFFVMFLLTREDKDLFHSLALSLRRRKR